MLAPQATRLPVQRRAAAHSSSVLRIILRQPARTQQIARAQGSNNPVEGAINWLTVALKNSPINEGKKALAKAQGTCNGIDPCSAAALPPHELHGRMLAHKRSAVAAAVLSTLPCCSICMHSLCIHCLAVLLLVAVVAAAAAAALLLCYSR
jgi:hypothetical protein